MSRHRHARTIHVQGPPEFDLAHALGLLAQVWVIEGARLGAAAIGMVVHDAREAQTGVTVLPRDAALEIVHAMARDFGVDAGAPMFARLTEPAGDRALWVVVNDGNAIETMRITRRPLVLAPGGTA